MPNLSPLEAQKRLFRTNQEGIVQGAFELGGFSYDFDEFDAAVATEKATGRVYFTSGEMGTLVDESSVWIYVGHLAK